MPLTDVPVYNYINQDTEWEEGAARRELAVVVFFRAKLLGNIRFDQLSLPHLCNLNISEHEYTRSAQRERERERERECVCLVSICCYQTNYEKVNSQTNSVLWQTAGEGSWTRGQNTEHSFFYFLLFNFKAFDSISNESHNRTSKGKINTLDKENTPQTGLIAGQTVLYCCTMCCRGEYWGFEVGHVKRWKCLNIAAQHVRVWFW